MNRVAAAAIAVGLVAVTLAAGRVPAAPLSAADIVARNVAARGGLEAWRKVQTMVWVGHIESAHAVAPGLQFMMSQKRPNKMRFEINALGDKTLRVFDGHQGWKMRSTHGRPGVQPYTIEEERFAQAGPGLDGPLIDYAAKGSAVSLVGMDEIEKRKAYHLIVTTTSGERQHIWVDGASFLEVRYDRPAGAAAAARTVSVIYRDYKRTDGLNVPSVIETAVGPGVPPDRMVIERVVVNPSLTDQTFTMPGQHGLRERVPFPPHRRTAPSGTLPAPLPSPTPPVAPPTERAPGPVEPDSPAAPQ